MCHSWLTINSVIDLSIVHSLYPCTFPIGIFLACSDSNRQRIHSMLRVQNAIVSHTAKYVVVIESRHYAGTNVSWQIHDDAERTNGVIILKLLICYTQHCNCCILAKQGLIIHHQAILRETFICTLGALVK